MASIQCRPVLVIILLLYINISAPCDVQLKAYKPKGFKVFADDTPGITSFKFGGRINRDRQLYRGGDDITYEVTKPINGKWIIEDPNLALNPGSFVDFRAVLTINGSECTAHRSVFVVTGKREVAQLVLYKIYILYSAGFQPSLEIHDQLTEWNDMPLADAGTAKKCNPSATKVWGSIVCSGDVVFEENFNNLRHDLWQVEEYFPIRHPEYPFISYQSRVVSINNGLLQITPNLLQNYSGYSDDDYIVHKTYELYEACTGQIDQCSYTPSGYAIVPPVVSGRIISKGFAFTYGTVSVRAKLPQGDWLYPEILLEPLRKKYGADSFQSGIIKIACARGNEFLWQNYIDLSNKQLYGGPIIDRQCRDVLLKTHKSPEGKQWSDDFHVYKLQWTPDFIALSVDDVEWMRVDAPYFGHFPPVCKDIPIQPLISGGKSAPFDQFFYLTLGVAAGGITEFPDGIHGKPWRNNDIKAMLNYWRDLSSWYPTWKNPHLIVDYVKVVAL